MSLTTTHPLTPEQQAIVAHTDGPALVLAVAGSGKTTAMVHRIARLVREGSVAPQHILAASFTRATVTDIRTALAHWPACHRVTVATLHRVGRLAIASAIRHGWDRHRPQAPADGERQLLYATLGRVRQQRVPYRDELETLDHDDFLTYVSRCKGAIQYADLERADLPAAAYAVAQQAAAPPGLAWYLDLYQAYERVRHAQGAITFDDMLLTGWELLLRYPAVLADLRGQYRWLMIDEFQDVNRVQAELVDVLAAPAYQLMAIGDDDQTLYTWRGAEPQLILRFAERYQATVYRMQACFRCYAAPIALANAVIRANPQRAPKQMQVTRGVGGTTTITAYADDAALAASLVADVQAARAAGCAPAAMVVLVRLYAQTPPLEQALIAARMRYTIEGSGPFYEREELRTFLAYARLAHAERQLRHGQGVADAEITRVSAAWSASYNRPMRYLSKELSERIVNTVLGHGLPFGTVLRRMAGEVVGWQAARLIELAELLTWLAGELERGTALAVLSELERRLDYCAYLREHSGFPETGASRAANVQALLRYAEGKGPLAALLRHLDGLAELVGEAHASTAPHPDALTITTIHRAKGREWDIVYVPHVNQGIIPHGDPATWDEERRLLYVALTRSREQLHLAWVQTGRRSRFLEEIAVEQVLADVAALGRALHTAPDAWQARDALAWCAGRMG